MQVGALGPCGVAHLAAWPLVQGALLLTPVHLPRPSPAPKRILAVACAGTGGVGEHSRLYRFEFLCAKSCLLSQVYMHVSRGTASCSPACAENSSAQNVIASHNAYIALMTQQHHGKRTEGALLRLSTHSSSRRRITSTALVSQTHPNRSMPSGHRDNCARARQL